MNIQENIITREPIADPTPRNITSLLQSWAMQILGETFTEGEINYIIEKTATEVERLQSIENGPILNVVSQAMILTFLKTKEGERFIKEHFHYCEDTLVLEELRDHLNMSNKK